MPANVTLEHYEVLKHADGSLHELGRGAMGITYKAMDLQLHVPVALKVVNAAHLHSENARQRFIREARAAARLRHGNVASVFHLGEQGGNYFYVMEFIDGETVEALVRRQGPLPPALALRITTQVARALNAAQMHDLVHRDIKPANLMAVLEDDDLVIKVIDFGLATALIGDGDTGSHGIRDKVADTEGSADLTHGGIIGTPHYASPEQLEELEVDARSDIYSLGVTLYLLTGTTPFTGTIARVVGQHLTKPPPFEELSCPAPVIDLLRRMLAKDRAARPQSAADLRKEIEQCLKVLSPPERAAASRSSAPFATEPGDVRFETGVTVGQRYLITQELGESEAGTSFLARDLRDGGEVRLLALHRELLADRESFSQVEREVDAVCALTHPNLLDVYGLTNSGRAAFLVLDGTNGFTLRQLLRARRELALPEVCRLLEPAAAGLDYAIAQLPRLELGLHHLLVHFSNRDLNTDRLFSQPVTEWPEFVVQINLLATWRDLFAVTWAVGQTLVGGAGHHERKSIPGRAGALHAFGTLAYELLGGVASGFSGETFTPLASLDQAGNEVVRRVLDSPDSFASAAEFVQQLTGLNATSHVLAPSIPHEPGSSSASPAIESSPPSEHPTLPLAAEESLPSGSKRLRLSVAFVALFIVTAAGIAFYLNRDRAPRSSLTITTPQPATPAIAPPATPLASLPVTIPYPITPLPATPSPAPTRRELASAARLTAERLEARQQSREALAAWLKVAKEFPEFDSGRVELEMLLTRLRRRPGGLSRSEFNSMRPEILQSANLGVVAAMMVLGEELRGSDPAQAFAWYCAAAEGGEPLAMSQAGLMLSNGHGVPRDMRKAVAYFQAAADKNEPAAMTALAECYLSGEGVTADKGLAVSLFQKASDKGNERARNELGVCYLKGIGVAQNHREAFRLFTEAAELGSVAAITNLGTLYGQGTGVEKDHVKAAEKFKEASQKGDLNATYYHALCLENGVGLKPDPAAAKALFQKAAASGHGGAMEWCKSHDAPVKPRR